MANLDVADLSIGEVSRLTDISVPTLRMWEARYGFPQPGRLDGNHRRYTDEDCRLLTEVKRARATGRSMPEAIAMGRAAVRDAETSIFDGLQLRHPDMEIVTLPGPFMLAISTALEDEARSHASGALLVGAFQRRSAWRAARSRWDVLAEHAALAIVFADFPRVRRTSARSDVPVTGTAMSAEWAVICDAPAWRACLVGVESATTRGTRTWPRRTFRAMWSMEPAVVRDAGRLAVTIAARHAPEIADVAAPLLRARAAVPDDALRDASVLTTRVLENVLRVARRAVT